MTDVRTTSFRIPSQYFGQVYAYRGGARFAEAWSRVAVGRGGKNQNLPWNGLVTALRLLSGDLVKMYERTAEPYVLISRRPLPQATLRRVFRAWEHEIWLEGAQGFLADAVDDLHEDVLPVGERVAEHIARKQPLPKWIWDVGIWEVARRLSIEPLVINDGHVHFRLDTEGHLLSWARPVRVEDRKGRVAQALHQIAPRLISIPGLPEPVIHLPAHVSRLAPNWQGKLRTAWIDRGTDVPLLRVPVTGQKDGKGQWLKDKVWKGMNVELIRKLQLEPIPNPGEIDLGSDDRVKVRFKEPPAGFPIGKGPGQIFHEAVGLHGLRSLPEATPVELVKAHKVLRNRDTKKRDFGAALREVGRAGGGRPRLVLLYANPATRLRMLEQVRALSGVPQLDPSDETVVALADVDVVFLSPPGADRILVQLADEARVRGWLAEVLERFGPPTGPTAWLVETLPAELWSAKGNDPKPVLRRELARRGMVSQFLSPSSKPDEKPRKGRERPEDHAAVRALWDLSRLMGTFPHQFPALKGGKLSGTWCIGLHVFKPSSWESKEKGTAVSIVAVEAGGRGALGYTRRTGWAPLHQATAAFFADDNPLLPKDEDVVRTVESALDSFFVGHPERRAILFADAKRCRHLWPGLRDNGGEPLPGSVHRERLAIVRVRSDDTEVPQPGGIGGWPSDGRPGKPRTTNALLRLADETGDGACFYVSTPRVMAAMGEHRKHTRFTVSEKEMASDWHSLSATEIWVRRPGPFEPEELRELTALLCRQAPTWEGTLARPSPLHLAKVVLEDHPSKELASEGSEDPGADGE